MELVAACCGVVLVLGGHPCSLAICVVLYLSLPGKATCLDDFIATVDKTAYSLIFAAFVIVLFLLSYRLIRRASRNDGYIA